MAYSTSSVRILAYCVISLYCVLCLYCAQSADILSDLSSAGGQALSLFCGLIRFRSKMRSLVDGASIQKSSELIITATLAEAWTIFPCLKTDNLSLSPMGLIGWAG